MLRVMTILGTRPEIIRLSRVLASLDRAVDHRVVYTNQNYDYELSSIFFQQMGLRPADHVLNPDSRTVGSFLGALLPQVEVVLMEFRPHAVLILGDTNSSLSSIIAKRLQIPVYHMEAGNRCFDDNVPEEVNRKLVDHIADFNLVYTEHARRNLLSEGLPARRIYLTGSPLREVYDHYWPQIAKSDVLGRFGLDVRRYFVASFHRQENVDEVKHLRSLTGTLNELARRYDCAVIVSTHPRTRARLDAEGIVPNIGVEFMKPFGFIDYAWLQKNALLTVSDSGTISEEAVMLEFPAITVRNSIERPEAMDTGAILVAGLDQENILDCVDSSLRAWSRGVRPEAPQEYRVTNCSERVTNLIQGTARLHRQWANLAR